MQNNLLTKDEVVFFETNGYLVLPPERIFPAEQIKKLKEECDTYFPSFLAKSDIDQSGKMKVGLSGTAKNYAFGTSDISDLKKNLFFAKRATVIAPKYSQNFVDALENENLLSINKQLLGSDKLSLHNSAIACTYPGTIAEPGNFHADTSGFSDRPLQAMKSGNFMVNSFVYLVDVNEENAPIRLLPKSHTDYFMLNRLVAPYFRSTEDVNNIGQFNFYDEFLPEGYGKPVRVIGKAGTVVLISGDLLHSATSNLSKDQIRYSLAIWYSTRNNPNFYKDYSVYASYCQAFIDKFKDKEIPYHTYYAHSIGLKFKIRKFLKKYFQGIVGKIFRKFQSLLIKSKEKKFLIDQGPWKTKQNSDLASNKAIVLGHLTESDSNVAKTKLETFIRKNTGVKELFLVAPNAESFLQRYLQKDYHFFGKLPFKHYFSDESWPRYIVRYFSAIASSYATEADCKNTLTSSEKEFYANLTQLESKLLDRNVNLVELESDLPRSRWNSESLNQLAFGLGWKKIDVTKAEKVSIALALGGEIDAWHILKFQK